MKGLMNEYELFLKAFESLFVQIEGVNIFLIRDEWIFFCGFLLVGTDMDLLLFVDVT